MIELAIRLKCTGCNGLEAWTRESENVVRCDTCGKRHSTDSLHAVEP